MAAQATDASSGVARKPLYVGYYQEDPETNPEDPTAGAFVLAIPAEDGEFKGSMFFTYVGCQDSNVGEVKGTKKGNTLSGTWAGTIDNSPESGSYTGNFDQSTGFYSGTYEVSGGKQFKSIPNCIQYYIAPDGRWEMFEVNRSVPATFRINVLGNQVSWNALPGAAMTLVYVVDAELAATAANAVKMQTPLPGTTNSFNLAPLHLTSGKHYIFSALVSDRKTSRIAFSSTEFVAPPR